MNLIQLVIRQPVTVTVGVILIIMAGLIALDRIPIQLTPNVEDTIVTVTTTWEGASPEEIEREIIEEQEEKLQGVTNLRFMTSQSQQGEGQIRLEFEVGTRKADALQEVSDKLREVPEYPDNVDEPVIAATDRENRDYIAWIIFSTTDPDLDIRTLQDFAEDHVQPMLERVEGVSEINVLGGREREAQIRFDPIRLAQFGIPMRDLVDAIQRTNRNVSAGELADAKYDVRVRTTSQYESVEGVLDTVIAQTEAGPVYVREVADVVETYKEQRHFVRSKGRQVLAINAQKEVGANVMAVMARLRSAIADLNAPGGVLDIKARQMNLDGNLALEQVYDQTVYIDDALALVQNNIWLGGGIAVLVLLLFLRSVRSVGIIALAIPISVIGAIVAMAGLGRTVNVISLAGMAFAVGMVVDNAIVVLENIFRHLELGKRPMRAAYDGTREVWGAVLASTLTTIVVFIPILLIEEEAGQLFRDIALAICAAVGLSLLVSITVIPTTAARILRTRQRREEPAVASARPKGDVRESAVKRILFTPGRRLGAVLRPLRRPSDSIGRLVYFLCGSVLARVAIVAGLTAASIYGTLALMPPADYLPTGNRNLVFGLMIPPPGYNVEKGRELALRIEETVRPFWLAGELDPESEAYEEAIESLPLVPRAPMQNPGPPVRPAPLNNYFLVKFADIMFQGGVSADPARVADTVALLSHAARPEVLPGVFGFVNQASLFRVGGSSGTAVKVNFVGDDLGHVSSAAQQVFMTLGEEYGFQSVQPDPGNFNLRRNELHIIPDRRALADVGMTPADVALAMQASGDGAIIGEYRIAGDSIDLKIIAQSSVDQEAIGDLDDIPLATPIGRVVPLGTLAKTPRTTGPPQINHSDRQRAVTLQVTAPEGVALEHLIDDIKEEVAALRSQGRVRPEVAVTYTGSASKLEAVRNALLGDGTFLGTLNSSLVLALIVVYLMMCVLFQSFLRPLVIMFSVPLATVGGFIALAIVHEWSVADRYMPVQKLDVLTMLGFIILIGVVVNNAILIVHQAGHFMSGSGDTREGEGITLPPRRAIAESVRTRVRPIFMSTLTSVGGMMPLIVMPGSGSELYRGLGSVVVGGLLISTVFTILLVPLLLSLVLDLQQFILRKPVTAPSADIAEAPGAAVPAGAMRSRE